MKLTKNTDFRIAKGMLNNVFTKTDTLNYEKWVGFINNHLDFFIWNEETEEGKNRLRNIHNVPDDFKERVLASLNKVSCFAEFNSKKGLYNIGVSFYGDLNWIRIQFTRTPRIEDLRIFFEMANDLDALLLIEGKKIVDKEMIDSFT